MVTKRCTRAYIFPILLFVEVLGSIVLTYNCVLLYKKKYYIATTF